MIHEIICGFSVADLSTSAVSKVVGTASSYSEIVTVALVVKLAATCNRHSNSHIRYISRWSAIGTDP